MMNIKRDSNEVVQPALHGRDRKNRNDVFGLKAIKNLMPWAMFKTILTTSALLSSVQLA